MRFSFLNFRQRNKKLLFICFSILLLVLAGYLLRGCYSYALKAREGRSRLEKRKRDWGKLNVSLNKEIGKFNGKPGVVIIDLTTGWEFAYNKESLFPSASLVKVPIMAATLVACAQNRLDLKQTVVLRKTDKIGGSGSLKGLPAGSVFTLGRLVGLMICDSDNTATNIVTNLAGIDYLNRAFKSFGLKDTFLLRRVADYKARSRGIENYTTARDMALLFEKIYSRKLASGRISDQCISILKLAHSNDRIVRYLPSHVAVAHKTGLEHNVCHDAGIVFTGKGDFIVIALTRHRNANSLASKKFIAKISLLVYRYFAGN